MHINNEKAIYDVEIMTLICKICGVAKSKYEWVQLKSHINSKRNNNRNQELKEELQARK